MHCEGKPLEHPICGEWPYNDYRDQVWICGRSFLRARWKWPYDGVEEQYREDVEYDAMHLKVYEDGTFIIDHLDAANPDQGHPVAHFFRDTSAGCAVKNVGRGAAVGLLILGVGSALFRGFK